MNDAKIGMTWARENRPARKPFTFICVVAEDDELLALRDAAMNEFWAAGQACQASGGPLNQQLAAAVDAKATFVLTIYRKGKMKLRQISSTKDTTVTSARKAIDLLAGRV